jgi:hypothetical protein
MGALYRREDVLGYEPSVVKKILAPSGALKTN